MICRVWRCFACRFYVVIICHSHYLAALAPLGLGALVSQCHFRPVNSPVNSRVNRRFKSANTLWKHRVMLAITRADQFEAPLELAVSFYCRVRP